MRLGDVTYGMATLVHGALVYLKLARIVTNVFSHDEDI